jgi:ribosomal protein L7/L12
MISIQVTIAEAIAIANTAGNDLHDRIVKNIEVALGINQSRDVTITKMPGDNRIPCIKAIRLHSGWGLREAKEWTDMLVGRYDTNIGRWVTGGIKNTIKLPTPAAAEALLRDLVGLGCEGYLS